MHKPKFRVWDKERKRMEGVRNVYFCENGDLSITIARRKIYLGEGQYELMQYTGLKDKNGVEIYEGDIVQYNLVREYGPHYDPDTLGFIGNDWNTDAVLTGKVSIWPSNGVMMTGIVTDDEEMFNSDHPIPKRWHVTRECEVIGNIHETPELLQGGAQ